MRRFQNTVKFPTLLYQVRMLSEKQILGVPFQLSAKDAAKQFSDFDANRLFAPINWKVTEGLIASNGSALSAHYLPAAFCSITVNATQYSGQYGIKKYRTVYRRDEKGHLKPHTESYIDWRSTGGTLSQKIYSFNISEMRLYAGKKYPESLVQSALPEKFSLSETKPFDQSLIPENCIVEPFTCNAAIIHSLILQNMNTLENARAHRAIEKQHDTSHTSVNKISVKHGVPQFQAIMLPFYLLQYSEMTPRFLAAYNNGEVVGLNKFSVTKLSAVTCVLSLFAIACAPEITTTMMIIPFATSMMTALLAKIIFEYRSSNYHSEIKHRVNATETIAESPSDKIRRIATEQFVKAIPEQNTQITVAPEHYETLNLDAKKLYSKTEIENAIHEQCRLHHPDAGGSVNQFRRVVNARDAFRNAWNNPITTQRRFFSTSSENPKLHIKEPPRSIHSPYARQLITLVLEKENYNDALALVRNDTVHPDAHDNNENTLLTEAAKQGNLKAVKFAVNELGCSVDTSCDCPDHRTALHYASEKGHENIVEFLVEKKASLNLINSRGETALTLAKISNHNNIVNFLEAHGAVENQKPYGYLQSLKRTLFGYGSNERTIVEERKKIERDTVICLPPSQMK